MFIIFQKKLKKKLIEIFEKNTKTFIEWYSKNYKHYVYKIYNIVIKQPTVLEKINMIKKYINNELNIIKRNYYLQKFIDNFTVKSESSELWLLNRFDNKNYYVNITYIL